MNDVWIKMVEFLGRLNGENVKRESYVRTPEYEKALEAWKEKEQEWEDFFGNPFRRTEREGGGNKGVSGGFCLCAGAAGIYPGLCGLCAGAVSYGASERK